MNNPMRVLASWLNGPEQPSSPAREIPPPAMADAAPIKVEVPADLVEAVSHKPRLPQENLRQHNHATEQRVKAANLHRPVVTHSLPHARGR